MPIVACFRKGIADVDHSFKILVLIASFVLCASAPAQEEPNIILVGDDPGYGEFSCHGIPVVRTLSTLPSACRCRKVPRRWRQGQAGNPWQGHPFHRSNNVNGVDGDLNGDGQGPEIHTLKAPAEILRLQ